MSLNLLLKAPLAQGAVQAHVLQVEVRPAASMFPATSQCRAFEELPQQTRRQPFVLL
jgi:hypothetical protein